jgi:hypothetical protein
MIGIALYLTASAILCGLALLGYMMLHNREVDTMQKWTDTGDMPANAKAHKITWRFGMKPLRSLAGRDGLVIWARKRRWLETLGRVFRKRPISRRATRS